MLPDARIKKSSSAAIKQNKKPRLIYWLLLLIILIAVLLIFRPYKVLSRHFVENGDSLLLQKKYVSAGLEYEKALMLDRNNDAARLHKEIAKKSQTDIGALTPFLIEKNAQDELDKIDLANTFPKNENSALELSKKLMDEGEYQLAIIPAQTATEMAPDYDVAKTYLAVAKTKASQLTELTPNAQNYYSQSN